MRDKLKSSQTKGEEQNKIRIKDKEKITRLEDTGTNKALSYIVTDRHLIVN